MHEYICTYSGGEVDYDGTPWTNTNNTWDGDDDTYAINAVLTDWVPFIPYSYWYNYTYSLIGTDHDNTATSGTIYRVYSNIYGYSPAPPSGTLADYYYGFMFTLVSGEYMNWWHEFHLPTTSGNYISVDITRAVDGWTWDKLNATDIEIYFDSGNYLSTVNLEVNSMKLRVITSD